MALSTYFNFETLQIPNLETNTFHEAMPEEVAAPNLQHFFPYSDESFFLSNTLVEDYIDPTCGFLYPPDINHPYDPVTSLTPPPDDFTSLTPPPDDIFLTHEEYNILPCPKRKKCCYEENQQHQEVAAPNLQQLLPYSEESCFLSNALFENYIDPTSGFLYPPDINPPYDEDIFPTHKDYKLLPCLKRQRCCYEEQQQQEHVYSSSMQEFSTPTLSSNFLDDFVIPYDNCFSLQAEELQQQLFSETQYGDTCVDPPCEKKGNERTISPQSNFLDDFVIPYDNCFSLQAEELQQQLFSETQYGDTCVGPPCEKKGNERTISPQSNFLDDFVIPYDNCFSLQAEELQQQLFSKTQYGDTCVDPPCEKKGNERTISPQSVAARERRRKITKKTQELGKLVPGGPNMNTAEMFQAAGKYIKYLQAQVEMLELMNTLKEDKAEPPSENLHALVVSPFVQEKLYTEEKCFVPKEVVTTLTNHEDFQSRPTILADLKQLIGTDIEKKAKQE